MKKLTLSIAAIMCLMLVLPALSMAKKPQQNHVEILYVDKEDSNTVIASAEFLPQGPGRYVLDNESTVVKENLPEGYELLEGNHFVINVHNDGRPSPDTVKFKVQAVSPETTPAPTAEPTATPAPTAEPTATPAPTAEPTATPAPTAEPTATPAPTTEPTATPAPTAEPTATPTPTAEPTATPAPTATPKPTVKPTASPTPGSDAEYEAPKSGSPSVLFAAMGAITAAAAFLRRR